MSESRCPSRLVRPRRSYPLKGPAYLVQNMEWDKWGWCIRVHVCGTRQGHQGPRERESLKCNLE